MARTPALKTEEGITQQEAWFADEWLVDFNGKYAAIRVGVDPSNAAQWASRVRRKPLVAAAIEKRIAEKRRQAQDLRDVVLNELTAIATSRHNHYRVDPDSGALTLNGVALEQTDRAHAAVQSIKHRTFVEEHGDTVRTVHEVEFKLWDKNTALRNLGTHLGMFIERTAQATDPEHPDGNKTVWDFGGKKIAF